MHALHTMRALTKYGPKSQLSPTIGNPCCVCGNPFAPGDFTTLVGAETPRHYIDDAREVHWACADILTVPNES